jgi:F-type H+-transporting ATPase subunit b
MPQLDFSTYPGQILWLLLSFAFLYLVVHLFVFPKIIQNVNSRVSLIKNNLEIVELTMQKISSLEKDIEEEMSKTKNLCHSMIVEAEKEAKSLITQKSLDSDRIVSETLKKKFTELESLVNSEFHNSDDLIKGIKVKILERCYRA